MKHTGNCAVVKAFNNILNVNCFRGKLYPNNTYYFYINNILNVKKN